ncbi:MAG: nicotinate-nucleotide--dimethylbenzimidazole phosphoribosyltransferase [Micavibrio sp.]|nr:nicotinate-nucleotide--dimethylbenzimidazole phosphoribosyltransferase [Micavibrio sp.]
MTNAAAKTATEAASATTIDLAEIITLVRDVLPQQAAVTTGGEDLGAFTPVWRWLAAAQQKNTPAIIHPRIALFAADHSANPASKKNVEAALAALGSGKHRLTALAADSNADLQVYDLTGAPEAHKPQLENRHIEPSEAAHAVSYGLMAVQPGIDLLVMAALNADAETAGAKIIAALKTGSDPMQALTQNGGLDICAMLGTLAAARLAHIPVILDGAAAEAAAALMTALRVDAADHCRRADDILQASGSIKPGISGALLLSFLKSLVKAG